MKIDCISDLHGFYPELEGGDLLIIAGDWTRSDQSDEIMEFGVWLARQKYRRKIVIAGNHDNMIQISPEIFRGISEHLLSYLCDSGTEFEGLKIWGSPWTKKFKGMNPKCMAFTVDTDEELAEKWNLIPDDTDILVTHSPRRFVHDKVVKYNIDFSNFVNDNVGSDSLAKWICRNSKRLKLHVCGHVHEGYGVYDIREVLKKNGDDMIPVMVNASYVNHRYQPVNKPVTIEL